MIKIMSRAKYTIMLENIQNYISENYSSEVASLHSKSDNEVRMKEIIKRSLIAKGYFDNHDENLERAISLLYEDMAGMSFLAKYLRNINKYPELEEININSWNSIHLLFSGNKTERAKEAFLSPTHAVDIIKNIFSMHGKTLDNSEPAVTSYITENIRITAYIYPIVSKEVGVTASIRITRPDKITEESLIEQGTVSSEIMDFLMLSIKSGVSCVVGGKMGAGKTSFLNYMLSKIPESERIYLIEEGSRECKLARYDKWGRMTNQVVSTLTRPSDDSRQNFDSSKLLELGLRFDADYIIPQEMRSGEAYVATESARTGSTVLTTIHSNDAERTYSRMMTLMQKVSEQSEDTLMRLAVEAFPLSVYMKKCNDGKRRVMEVLEAVSYSHEKGLECRTIYRFCVDDNLYDEKGKIEKVVGHFEKVCPISQRLARILLNNGVERKIVEQYKTCEVNENAS